jgi:hypothetical protein
VLPILRNSFKGWFKFIKKTSRICQIIGNYAIEKFLAIAQIVLKYVEIVVKYAYIKVLKISIFVSKYAGIIFEYTLDKIFIFVVMSVKITSDAIVGWILLAIKIVSICLKVGKILWTYIGSPIYLLVRIIFENIINLVSKSVVKSA